MDSRYSTPDGQCRTPRSAASGVPLTLQEAYAYCLDLARHHCENFPVASRMLPGALRKPVAVIYAFARHGDNLADEGQMTPAERLCELASLEARLDLLKVGALVNDPLFLSLKDVIERHRLPLQPFYDLLQAFRMDVRKKRYAHFGELMEYCRYSANPIGRLLLFLFGVSNPRHRSYADALTSAVQIIDHVHDMGEDYEKRGRIYLPQEDMDRLGVSEEHIRDRRSDEALHNLVALQLNRAEHLLETAAPLCRTLKGRIGLETRLIYFGAKRMLHLLRRRADPFDTLRLNQRDWGWIAWKALWRFS
ncbi:MAG: squalene synthase HpnC [Gammaproteobacteria bacterium]|nr:MAG: squalene synthase HpnC [Gammaproteobacteria bacterium]